MKIRAVVFGLTLALSPLGVNAGSGHDHGGGGHAHSMVSSELAMEMATQKVQQLVSAGKLDATWSAVTASGAEQKAFAKGPEWVVTFKNDKVADATKQTLYVFMSLDGHYIAANYTGN